MPTYEYQCLKCKKKFDQLQKITAAPLKKCIYCGGKVERLISAGTGFIFKGSGFYITDYKKKPPADVTASPAGGGSLPGRPAGASSGKTEPKKEKTDKPVGEKKKG